MSAVLDTPITMIEPPKQYAVTQSATPADLVRYAMDSGADIERLEKLMQMQIIWEEREAKKAFVLAMAEFKRNPPEIFKTKQVSFTTRDGDTTSYKHATLGGVTEPIINGLAQHGISHRWDTKQDGQVITVTCTLTHKLGHSESTSLTGMPDASGKKNPIQQMASCVNYLQRYTLLAATGIATKDMDAEDDDGRGASQVDNTELLTKWINEANAAADTAALERVWGMGVADFNAARDMAGYKAFKAQVAQRGAELKGSK